MSSTFVPFMAVVVTLTPGCARGYTLLDLRETIKVRHGSTVAACLAGVVDSNRIYYQVRVAPTEQIFATINLSSDAREVLTVAKESELVAALADELTFGFGRPVPVDVIATSAAAS